MYPGAYISQFPDKPAAIVAETGKQVTYGELEDRSWRLACHLYGAGLRPGDHIALLTDNDPVAFEVYWAALRSGLHITAVNWHLTAVEAAYIIDDCGARALLRWPSPPRRSSPAHRSWSSGSRSAARSAATTRTRRYLSSR